MYVIDEIEDIIDLGIIESEVYDIGMVDHPHMFFANDILVHNSNFIRLNDFVDENDSVEVNIAKIKEIAEPMQKYVNKAMDDFVTDQFNVNLLNDLHVKFTTETHNIYHFLEMKQEIIADSGFFSGAKKRYALNVVEKEGRRISAEDGLMVRGIDVRRSDFPLYFKDKLETILKMILARATNVEVNIFVKDIIANMKGQKLWQISIPKGVKKIDKFLDPHALYIKGSPGHVKSAINYNFLLKLWKLDKEFTKIYEGEKVRHIILKPNEFMFERIAFKDKLPKIIEDFIWNYVNQNAIFAGVFENKLDKFYEALKWERWDEEENEFF